MVGQEVGCGEKVCQKAFALLDLGSWLLWWLSVKDSKTVKNADHCTFEAPWSCFPPAAKMPAPVSFQSENEISAQACSPAVDLLLAASFSSSWLALLAMAPWRGCPQMNDSAANASVPLPKEPSREGTRVDFIVLVMCINNENCKSFFCFETLIHGRVETSALLLSMPRCLKTY